MYKKNFRSYSPVALLFKKTAHILWYHMKGLSELNNFCYYSFSLFPKVSKLLAKKCENFGKNFTLIFVNEPEFLLLSFRPMLRFLAHVQPFPRLLL